ncbi:hypothetical protein FOXYS1_911 [Fusarium oxysporum]|uniref:Zn(2)-C6 fungal-type domain-containing protein n=1 Tax=Fusarium oxysporum TaxID=5507 RepID=A0A8H5EPP2_FUSOX|nr:hypothetical protein FOXYS1_911 [Fusarium oxysporum]
MRPGSLPSPPANDHKSTLSRKSTSSSTKSVKPVHRTSKRCDGGFPCKRCKGDGLVCTAGVRKKIEYKQLPRGYAEVLENTQFDLIATVHKLYSMVRNNQSRDLSEPELNDRGQPVIHNIAQKLGCIRPNRDIGLPVHSVFPEDEDNYRKAAFGNANAMILSPQSFTGSTDFDFAHPPPGIDASTLFPSQSPAMSNFPVWPMAKP